MQRQPNSELNKPYGADTVYKRMTNRPGYIYALIDPRTGKVRYIGKTHRTPAKRLAAHLWSAKPGSTTRCLRWIASLKAIGLRPELRIIGAAQDSAELAALEISAIANHPFPEDLTNHTKGGEGIPGYQHRPETRAQMSAKRKGIVYSPETRARMSASGKTRIPPTPETRAKLSAAHRGRIDSLETRQKKSRAAKGNQHFLGHQHSPETKRKLAAAKRARIVTDDARANMSAAHKGKSNNWLGRRHTAESRAKISAANRRRTYPVRKPVTAESRAKMSASAKRRYQRQQVSVQMELDF